MLKQHKIKSTLIISVGTYFYESANETKIPLRKRNVPMLIITARSRRP